jgi:hypothetical protein
MADREMIAATLVSGLLAGKFFAGTRVSPEDYAVSAYHKVLAALAVADANAPTQVASEQEAFAAKLKR